MMLNVLTHGDAPSLHDPAFNLQNCQYVTYGNPNPCYDVMVSEDGAFGRLVGHEPRAAVNEIHAYRYLRSSLGLFHQMKIQEDSVQPRKALSPEPTHAGTWPHMHSFYDAFLLFISHQAYDT